ncbi:ornithine cyclodeaminase family protein [Nocardia sp. X0981]
MTVHLDSHTIRSLCTEEVAYEAAQIALEGQRQGRFALPPRIDVDLPSGFFRSMPAALGDVMGTKLMTSARGVGNRYLLLLYRQETGELLATLDASEVTKLRTAATTAVAGSLLCPDGTDVLGLVGTGFEAEGHLRAFARLWPLRKVRVFGRDARRRGAFAARLSAETGVEIEPVQDISEVVAACSVTVLCTKSPKPVVDGTAFATGATVLSIGSTRPDLRELDDTTFSRARAVLVDDVRQVLQESGDVASAVDNLAISGRSLVNMSDWDAGCTVESEGRDLLLFKSVGTALQDLALGAAIFDSAVRRRLGRDIGDISELKTAPTSNKERV